MVFPQSDDETVQDPFLTITVHGCAHPTTPPPSTTPPQPTTTPFESTTTSTARTTTPQPTTPKECYDEIGEASPRSDTDGEFYEINFSKVSIVNGISFESNAALSENLRLLVKIFSESSENPVIKVNYSVIYLISCVIWKIIVI